MERQELAWSFVSGVRESRSPPPGIGDRQDRLANDIAERQDRLAPEQADRTDVLENTVGVLDSN